MYHFVAYVAADAALTLDFNVDLSEASVSVDGTLDFTGVSTAGPRYRDTLTSFVFSY